MKRIIAREELDDHKVHQWSLEFISELETELHSKAIQKNELITLGMQKVLKAFSLHRLGNQHFFSLTGSAHSDIGREIIDNIFATIFGAEKAAVRLQYVSGTHAISSALFGVLRPGDHLLSITGKPYDTLEEVIGLRDSGQGSLKEFGISYEEIPLSNNGEVDFNLLSKALEIPRKMIFIQRSCGYSWRPALSINTIQKACECIHEKQPECICFVDNCYGEFVEEKEPTEVGADLIAGSLIKNPGGTIVPTGGYIAGRGDLVEKACCSLTAPGIGASSGTSFDLNRLVLQGLFLAPQIVAESLLGAELVSRAFNKLGFAVQPKPGDHRGDVIQAVQLGSPEALKIVCKAFQEASPVGSYLDPVPAEMPGYENDLVMAGGTFVDGSTSEFSADAPLRPPYNLFVQGGIHHSHVKIALQNALVALVSKGCVELPIIN